MKKSLLNTTVLLGIILLSACGGTPATSAPAGNSFEVIGVNAGKITTNEIRQTKVFDQCQSSSPLKAEISFSDLSSTQTGKQLVLGGSVGGELGLSAAAKVTVEGSIQQHYSSQSGGSVGHQESINIEVPAHSKQQYEILWTEFRQSGTVEYSENGENGSVGYDYRQGVQLSSSSVIDLACPGGAPEQNPSVEAPQPTAARAEVPTVAPLFPLSNGGVAEGDGLRLTATILCLVNCGNPTFPDYDPLIDIQYKLTNTSNQMIILPQFGGDESYIALNTGQQLYVWTSIGWCDRDAYFESQSIGPGETIKWEWGYKLKNNECGGIGDMLALPDSAASFTIVFPAIGERFGGAAWEGMIPR